MIKKLLLSTIAVTSMLGSALAADLPRRAPPPVYVPPPPVFLWQGFYVGLNAGAFWTNSRNITTVGSDFGVATPGAGPFGTAAALAVTNNFGNNGNNNRVGFIGGAQWGYNWQWNQIVLGTESDFQGTFDSCH